MSGLEKHRMYTFLLAQAQDASSLAEAERNLRLLHAVLVARLANRKGEGYAPSEGEVYSELKRMLGETI